MPSRHLVRLGAARLVMKMADSLLSFAIPLLVYQSTRSVAWSGLAFFIEKLPRILFLPFGGWLADRFGGLKLMIASDFLRAILLVSAFAAISKDPRTAAWILPAVGALIAVMNAQTFVALETFLSQGLKSGGPAHQMVYFQIADQASVVAGPMIAAATQVFSNTLYLLPGAALLYLLSVGFVLGVKEESEDTAKSEDTVKTKSHPLADLKRGFGYVCQDRRLVTLAIWAFSLNLIIGLSLASSAAVVAGRLGLNASAYSLLQLCCGVISLFMMLILPRLDFTKHIDRAGVLSYLIIVAGCILTGFADHISVLILGYSLLSSPVGIFNVYIRTKRALWIDSHLRGTVTGILLLLGQTGLPAAGLLLNAMGTEQARAPFFAAGGLALVLFALSAKLSSGYLKPNILRSSDMRPGPPARKSTAIVKKTAASS